MDCSQDHYTFGDISQGINRPIGYILNRRITITNKCLQSVSQAVKSHDIQ